MKTITLCGSVRFKLFFDLASETLQEMGYCVHSLSLFGNGLLGYINDENLMKPLLEETHFQKIDQSDAIYVLDIHRYIGKSTAKEISHALETGKQIHYWSKDDLGLVTHIMTLLVRSTF